MVVDPKLIGISGKIGNGKDLLFDVINYIITEDYWTSFEHYMHESRKVDEVYENKKFAGILKDITSKLIGCNVSQLEDREFKEAELGEEWNGLTPRKLLQLLGTEAGRQIIHSNIWVNALFSAYKPEDNWIVTDVRFSNEADIIKDKGGIMIRINRDSWKPKAGDTIKIKVFSDWSTVTYTHTDDEGNHYGIGTDGFKYKSSLIKEYKKEHLSETALDDYDGFDYVIENDGTVQDLIDKVKSLNIVEKIL